MGFTLVAAAMLLMALAANWRKADSDELFFHLQSGEVIANSAKVPNRDIFSAAASVEPWAYIEWLWALALNLAWRPLEWVGINAVSVGLAVVTAFLLLIRSRRYGASMFETLITSAAYFVVMIPAWQPSPLIAMAPLFLFVLLLTEARKLWPLVLVPAIAALWANMHPAFLLPLLPPLMRLVVRERALEPGSLPPAKPRAFLVVIVATGLLAALFSPHSVLIYPAMLDRFAAAAAAFVSAPVAHFADPAYLIRLVAAIAFGAVAAAGRVVLPRWQLATAGMLTIASLTVTPDAVNFLLALLAAPAARGLTQILSRTWSIRSVRLLAPTALLLLVLMAVPVVLLSTGLVGNVWGAGIRAGVFPETAAGRMAAIPLRSSVLNRTEHGGYLTWRLWPGWKVTSDERSTLYGAEFREQYDKLWQGATGWQAMLSLWRVYAVLGNNEVARENPRQNLYYELADSPDWVAVYWDKGSILYMKEGINLAATNLAAFRQLKPGISWPAMKERIQSREQWDELAADLRRALVDDPTNELAREFLRLTQQEIGSN